MERVSREQRSPPVAVCTRCGTFTKNVTLINLRCGQRFDKKRCQGAFGSALNTTDWTVCPECAGTGLAGEKNCPRCDGVGWHYARRRY